jgi:hypothetical protein
VYISCRPKDATCEARFEAAEAAATEAVTAAAAMPPLILKRGSISRSSGQWRDDD